MARETYLWVLEDDACELCVELEGYHDEPQEFPHPNCQCRQYAVEMSKTAFDRLPEDDKQAVLEQSEVVDATKTMTRKYFDSLPAKRKTSVMARGVTLVD